jgi:nucleoside-diphosphate-sugar epimerase
MSNSSPSRGSGPASSGRANGEADAAMGGAMSTATDGAFATDDHARTKKVVITGVSGALGRRVVAALAQTSDWSVLGIDTAWFPSGVPKPRRFTVHSLDLRSTHLTGLFNGADCLVHLAADDPAQLENPKTERNDGAVTSRVLAAAASAGITQVVCISSGVVYGAWPDNPVPLTEDAPLRPNPGFAFGEAKIELERLANTWRRQHPSTRVAILRPAVTLGHPESRSWLRAAVQPTLVDRLGHGLPVMQYVHVEDVASAVLTCLREQLDGTFNVAADDWLQTEEAHELLGPNLRLPIPSWLTYVLRTISDRWPGRRRPNGAQPYSQYPWVLANDRLKAAGWSPQSKTAEAYVANRRPSNLARYIAKHRQEVTLAAVGSVSLAVFSLIVGSVIRLRNRKR